MCVCVCVYDYLSVNKYRLLPLILNLIGKCIFLFSLPYIGVYIYMYWPIGLEGRIIVNGLGDLGLIPGQVIPKTQKMVP